MNLIGMIGPGCEETSIKILKRVVKFEHELQ